MLVFFLLFQIVFESLPVSSSAHAQLFSSAVLQSVDYFAHLFAWAIFVTYMIIQRHEIWTWWFYHGRYNWRRYLVLGIFIWSATALMLVAKMWMGIGHVRSLYVLIAGFVVTSGALLSLPLIPYIKGQSVEKKRLSALQTFVALSAAQGVALWLPGASRMGLVFVAARWVGWSADAAWYWMIVTAFPLFGAAGLLGLIAGGAAEITAAGGWLLWSLVALAWLFSLALFLGASHMARSGRFWIFGCYTLGVALILSIYLFFGG